MLFTPTVVVRSVKVGHFSEQFLMIDREGFNFFFSFMSSDSKPIILNNFNGIVVLFNSNRRIGETN